MNYIKPTIKEEINNNLFVFRNNDYWIIANYYWKIEDVKEIYTYESLNVRNWNKTIYALKSISELKEFLHIKEKTKGVSLKNIAEFVSMDSYDKYQLLNKKITIKGLWPSTIKKIKEVINIEDYMDWVEKIEEIKNFLKNIQGTEEEKNEFIFNNLEKLKEMNESEIMSEYLKK